MDHKFFAVNFLGNLLNHKKIYLLYFILVIMYLARYLKISGKVPFIV